MINTENIERELVFVKDVTLEKPSNRNVHNYMDGWAMEQVVCSELDYVRKELLIDREKKYKRLWLDDADIENISNSYQFWIDEKLYLVFKNKTDNKKFKLIRAAKRGNYVYVNRVSKKIRDSLAFMNMEEFKSLCLRQDGRKYVTNILFVTLTCSQKLYNENRIDAWQNTQDEFNKFITRIRQLYGNVWVMRSHEATAKAYPHQHLLLIFSDTSFEAFENDGCWRIKEKHKIENHWHSFVDIQCATSMTAIKNYIVKDICKQHTKQAHSYIDNLSLAMNWFFRKRSFSISGSGTLQKIADLIEYSITQNLNEELIKKESAEWEFLGFTDAIFSQCWDKSPPDTFVVNLHDDFEGCYVYDSIFRVESKA